MVQALLNSDFFKLRPLAVVKIQFPSTKSRRRLISVSVYWPLVFSRFLDVPVVGVSWAEDEAEAFVEQSSCSG